MIEISKLKGKFKNILLKTYEINVFEKKRTLKYPMKESLII